MDKAIVSKFTRRPVWAFLLPAAVLLLVVGGGAIVYVIHLNTTPTHKTSKAKPQSPQELAKQLVTAGKNAKQPPTSDQKLAQLQQQLQNPKLSQSDQFDDYSNAAILAANLNKPEAKTYAQKALAIFPASDSRSDTAGYEAGLKQQLTDISQGNYSAIPH